MDIQTDITMPYAISPTQMKLYLNRQKTSFPLEMINYMLEYLYRPVHPTALMINNKYHEYYYFDTNTYSETPYFIWQCPSNLYGTGENISFHEWMLDYRPKYALYMWEEYGEKI